MHADYNLGITFEFIPKYYIATETKLIIIIIVIICMGHEKSRAV